MKNILVATDFSDNAKRALDVAVKLTKKQKAALHLFHSLQVQTYYTNVPMNLMGDMTNLLKSEADNEMMRLKKLIPADVQLKTYVGLNALTNELKDYIDKENIDIVIIGTGGGSKLQYSLFGSITNQIIDNISCLLLAVPPTYEFKIFSKMVYASDLTGDEFTPLVKFAEFAKLFDVDLTVLHIKTEVEESEKEITKLMAKVRLQTDYNKVHIHQKNHPNALEGINQYINENQPDIFAMATHNRNFFEKLVHISLTKKMTHISQVPLLIFHKEKIAKKTELLLNNNA